MSWLPKFERIYGQDGECWTPYLSRIVWGRLRLHVFHRGDGDPDPHDHAWDFWTFPLVSYLEERWAPGAEVPFCWTVHAFWPHRVAAEHRHRVMCRADERPWPIVTLVITGPKRREWGFWKGETFVPWRTYIFGEGGGRMIAYASRTGTKRNLDALRAVNREHDFAFWRMLVSRAGVWRTEGFPYCLDNGEWADFRAWISARLAEGLSEAEAIAAWIAGGWRDASFDEAAFDRLIDQFGPGADFTILPDIVAVSGPSLERSLRWMNRVRSVCNRVLIAVQDGMEPADLAPFVGPHVGIFLGGSTEWKLARMRDWGEACAGWDCWYHVARVNTERRFRMAHDAGADSVDGSSASRFAKTLPLLERARRQPSLLSPRVAA